MHRPIVPWLAFLAVLGLAGMLVVGMIIRPWELLSNSQANVVAGVPPNYNRSQLAYVGSDAAVDWQHSPAVHPSELGGREYFIYYGCASCHGLDGAGTRWAPMRITKAEQVRLMVRVGPKGMPIYPKEYLPDDVADSIASWLLAQTATRPQPTPTLTPTPTPTTPPQPKPVDPAHGEAVYSADCSACHGKGGKGTAFAPALNTPDFAAKFTADAAIVDVIRKGVGIMPGFDKLSDADLADVIAYLRSLQ